MHKTTLFLLLAALLAGRFAAPPGAFCAPQAADPESSAAKPRYPLGPKGPQPVVFAPKFRDISFSPDDVVVLYFLGQSRSAFEARGWACERLAEGHEGMLLCSRKGASGRAVLAATFFGEDAPDRLDPLFKRGARRFVTLSKAADLSDTLPIGALAAPETLISEEGKPLPPARNYAAQWFGAQLPGLAKTAHGWVLSPYDKTVQCLKTMRTAGARTMDLRHGYFTKWLASRPEAQGAGLLVVSYYPLGRDIDVHSTRSYSPATDRAAQAAREAVAASLATKGGK